MTKHAGLLGGLLVVALLALAPTANASNAGDIKVKDDRIGDQSNEPHVACEFYVEGFNMDVSAGNLTIVEQMPTGTDLVLEDNWTTDTPLSEDGFHFLSGPYELPPGHYKVSSTDEKNDKHKVFWVDECAEIPFFNTAGAIALGTLGALGGVWLVLRRKN